jgi:broad specificity phosphatase PhoE
LIVQHGEKERLPGDPGLTTLGTAQASLTAAWLQDQENLVAVWSSPFRRAVETAGPIVRAAGCGLVTDVRLRERMNWDDPNVQSIDEFLLDWRRASADRSYVPRSGDSSQDAANRFMAALGDLVGTYEEGTAVVVAHGGVTVDALRTLLGDERLLRDAPDLIDDGVPCCAITTLRFEGGRWMVDSLSSTAHLPASSKHRPA